jgi:hypothetical protein
MPTQRISIRSILWETFTYCLISDLYLVGPCQSGNFWDVIHSGSRELNSYAPDVCIVDWEMIVRYRKAEPRKRSSLIY